MPKEYIYAKVMYQSHMPKEFVRIKSFKKWRDYLLMHLRSKVFDCNELGVSPGIDDNEVGEFLRRLVMARVNKLGLHPG